MASFRVYVERQVFERGYYVVEAQDAEQAHKQAEALFIAGDPNNMELYGVGGEGCDSELLDVNMVEEIDEDDGEAVVSRAGYDAPEHQDRCLANESNDYI